MDTYILVVDGDPFGRKLLRILLASAGYSNVRVAVTPEEARRVIAASPPRLVLLDIGLPERDGLSLVRELRLDSRTAKIPIVVLSASPYLGDKRQAVDAGCDQYFPRPFDTRSLLDTVTTLLEHADGPGDLPM